MQDNYLMSGRKRATPKQFAFAIIMSYISFALIIIILHMSIFLPQMEKANEERQELIEETEGTDSSIVETKYIVGIRLVYILSLICFGLLDGLCAVVLWKVRVPKEQMVMFGNLAESYVAARAFSLLMITLLSVMILVSSNPRLFEDLLYLVVPIFSLISLIFILYFSRKFSMEKLEDEHLFDVQR